MNEILRCNEEWLRGRRRIFKKYQFYRRLRKLFFEAETGRREYPEHLIVKLNTILLPVILAEDATRALKILNEIEDEWLKWRYQ